MVFFLLASVPQVDVRRLYAPYEQARRGAPPFDPALMVCLWWSASSVGVLSSRQMAQACERHLAFLAIVGEARPDVRTISDVRTLPVEACKDVFVHGVRLAGEAGWVPWGHGSTDGTNLHGQASRHKAMRAGSMPQDVARLREAIAALVTPASQHETSDEAG